MGHVLQGLVHSTYHSCRMRVGSSSQECARFCSGSKCLVRVHTVLNQKAHMLLGAHVHHKPNTMCTILSMSFFIIVLDKDARLTR